MSQRKRTSIQQLKLVVYLAGGGFVIAMLIVIAGLFPDEFGSVTPALENREAWLALAAAGLVLAGAAFLLFREINRRREDLK